MKYFFTFPWQFIFEEFLTIFAQILLIISIIVFVFKLIHKITPSVIDDAFPNFKLKKLYVFNSIFLALYIGISIIVMNFHEKIIQHFLSNSSNLNKMISIIFKIKISLDDASTPKEFLREESHKMLNIFVDEFYNNGRIMQYTHYIACDTWELMFNVKTTCFLLLFAVIALIILDKNFKPKK